MLYQISHFVKDKLPFLWNCVEFLNEQLFMIRYGRKRRSIPSILNQYQDKYSIKEVTLDDLSSLVSFFSSQPPEAFTYFQPHEFDERSLKRLIKRKSHLMYIVEKEDCVVGYVFLRCFFNGKCFRGKMVDVRWRGKGIAVLMGDLSTEIALRLGLRMFGTISKENYASLYSSQASNEIKVIEELPNNYLYIEYLPKKKNT